MLHIFKTSFLLFLLITITSFNCSNASGFFDALFGDNSIDEPEHHDQADLTLNNAESGSLSIDHPLGHLGASGSSSKSLEIEKGEEEIAPIARPPPPPPPPQPIREPYYPPPPPPPPQPIREPYYPPPPPIRVRGPPPCNEGRVLRPQPHYYPPPPPQKVVYVQTGPGSETEAKTYANRYGSGGSARANNDEFRPRPPYIRV